MLFTDLHPYCLSVSELEAYLSRSPNIYLHLSPISRARKLLLLISFTTIWHFRRYCKENFSVPMHINVAWRCNGYVFINFVTPTAKTIQRQTKPRFQVSSERLTKVVSWLVILNRIRSVNLKMAISIPTIFVVYIFSVCLFA